MLVRSDRIHEREVSFSSDGWTLAGMLITPAGPGPYPAAVFVHGAIGGQRDFCRLFAGPLVETGLAVLIYDKRGHGRSADPPKPTIFDQTKAASAGVDLLAAQPDVDAGRIGLSGFSNGMWAVPMVAARRAGIAFVAGIGAAGVIMAEAEVHRRTKAMREAGVSASTVEAVAEVWRTVFAIATTGQADSGQTERLSAALAQVTAAPDLARYEIPEYARINPHALAGVVVHAGQ